MQSSQAFPQNLIWVIIIYPIFFYSSSSAVHRSEMSLICEFSKPMTSATISTSFIPNYVEIMDSILKQVSDHKWGYAYDTSSSPDIYALAQCRSDLSDLDCKLCFNQGRVKLPRCLPASSARIYVDGCFLRYDDYNFFHESTDPRYDSVNCSKSTGILADSFSSTDFRNMVAQVIENVTDMTTKNGKFATEEREGVAPIYALAQCWSTLDEEGCRKCLVRAGSKLKHCAPGEEGTALFTGCYMRYSTERFFNSSVQPRPNRGFKTCIITTIALSCLALGILTSFGAFIGYVRLSRRKEGQNNIGSLAAGSDLNFKYEVLERATDSFNESRKLGQGGAGSVFKGILSDGRTVAVKRLAYTARQWVDQFFNEVNLISGIQHKHLVRLLGCSIEGPESLLVYEYVPNRSLDKILFVQNSTSILGWKQRFDIILGTAKGLAYLHGGSGVRIIHRDIKTGNILLDEKFTPKIADFGLVRCVATDKSHISTGIAGTLGYMAPEYLVRGQLTEKADVYGFGVVVLEVASGKKNSIFSPSTSVLHTVWKHYQADAITDSIDPRLIGSFSEKEAVKVLQIGLLCTQASAALRPSMSEVVLMLTESECEIPSPKQPPFLNASVLSPEDDSTESCITRGEQADQLPPNDTQNSCRTTGSTANHSSTKTQYLTSSSDALLQETYNHRTSAQNGHRENSSGPVVKWSSSH